MLLAGLLVDTMSAKVHSVQAKVPSTLPPKPAPPCRPAGARGNMIARAPFARKFGAAVELLPPEARGPRSSLQRAQARAGLADRWRGLPMVF